MEHEEIFQRLKAVIAICLEIGPENINLDSSFVDDLDVDSIEKNSLLTDLELEFDLDIPDENVADIVSVREAVDYLFDEINL